MPKLDRDGVGIYYEAHGEGPVILLSHAAAPRRRTGGAEATR